VRALRLRPLVPVWAGPVAGVNANDVCRSGHAAAAGTTAATGTIAATRAARTTGTMAATGTEATWSARVARLSLTPGRSSPD
jgi:uncharacterized membrane protein